MSAATHASVPFSDFLRQPKETTGRLAQVRSLRLFRRDAEDLVLMYEHRAEAESMAVDTTARLLAAVTQRHPDLVNDFLPAVLPWVRLLPDQEQITFAHEFVSTAEASGSLGSPAALAQLLIEWRHTAEVHSDPELHRPRTRDHLDDHGEVAPPPLVAR